MDKILSIINIKFLKLDKGSWGGPVFPFVYKMQFVSKGPFPYGLDFSSFTHMNTLKPQ